MQKGTGSGKSLPPVLRKGTCDCRGSGRAGPGVGRAAPLSPLSPGSAAPLLVVVTVCRCQRGKTWLVPWKKEVRRHPERCHRFFRRQIGALSSRKCDLDHHPFAAEGGRDVGALISFGDSFLVKLLVFVFFFFSLPVCLFLHPFTSSLSAPC